MITTKHRTVRGKLGDFCEVVAYFCIAQVGRNRFVNTNFTKRRMEIADPMRREGLGTGNLHLLQVGSGR